MILFLTGCALFISPTEGTYEASVRDLDADSSCEELWGVDVDGLRDVDHTEVELGKDGTTMELDDEIECDLFGLDFECLHEQEEDVEGYSATLFQTLEIEGVWTSSVSFDSDWSMEIGCDGPDCGDLSDSCVITFTIEGELD